MPAKKHILTDDERRRRIRATARKIGADESTETLERAFKKIVPPKQAKKATSRNFSSK